MGITEAGSVPADVQERWYTVNEIAERLHLNPQTVRTWLRQGKLVGHHFGGPAGWRVKQSDLDAFLESRRRASDESEP